MRVAVIEDSGSRKQYRDVLIAFAEGCGGGITNSSNTKGYDCAVIFGSYKQERGRTAQQGKGRIIESGMPGKPPPVPRSSIVVPFLNFINFAITNEWRICLTYIFSISFLEITFILLFQYW